MLKTEYFNGRKKIHNSLKSSIIGDISGVYGVEGLSKDFLYSLALRSILRGGDENKEIILPDASNEIQSKLAHIKRNLLFILSISEKQVKTGDFSKLSKSLEREPYMRTPYYFDEDYIVENMNILKLVRDFGDKVYLAHFIKNSNLDHLLPNNTYTYLLGSNFEQVKKEALNRFESKRNFIVKAGEGASGENMILVFFENNKIFVSHHATHGKKEIKDIEDFKQELEIAIPESNRIKKGKFSINGYDRNAISEQYFLIQDLVDTQQYEEKSINFFIGENKIEITTYGRNIAIGGVHQGNIEEIAPKDLKDKFMSLLQKLKEAGYIGPIGFDFFYNLSNKEVKIVEANTRYTAPITPSMLVYKLTQQGKIPQGWTWKLIQKFPTKTDLLKVTNIKKEDLVQSIRDQEDIKRPKFLVYTPFNGKYQGVIIIGPNQTEINELYKKILNAINN